MKAAVTTESHGFEVVDLPDPTPGPDELVIRVAACGVCGSDVKAQVYAPAGMVMGHELGGEIVAVGSRAGEWRQGANIAVLPVFSCGTCQYCTAGVVSHCSQTRYIGMGPAGVRTGVPLARQPPPARAQESAGASKINSIAAKLGQILFPIIPD